MPCRCVSHCMCLDAGHPGSRWKRIAIVLLASLVLSGCVTRMAYGQLDWLTRWYVNSYFDLNDSQDRLAREIIGRNLAWHRATQLPQYAAHVRELRAGLGGGPVTAEFIAQQYATTLVIWDESLRHTSPDVALLLQSLSDTQVSEFFDELAERNAELVEEYSGRAPEARRRKQDRSIIRAFRWFTGPLASDQESVVRTYTAGMHDLAEQWLERRAAWQSALRELLLTRSAPDFEARLAQLLLDPNQFDSAEYRQLVAANRQIAFAMVAEVLSSLSPKQRKHLDDRLARLVADFEELARAPAR